MHSAELNLYADLIPPGAEAGSIAIAVPGRETVGYKDLADLSARYANVLQTCGLVPGGRVLAITDKSVEAIGLYLATLRAGGVFVPLNPAYTSAELEYFIADVRPTIVVSDPSRSEEVTRICDGLPARVLSLGSEGAGTLASESLTQSATHAVAARASEDLAAILYTSGTTGRSKGAMLSHGNLRANARALCNVWGYSDTDVLIHALPIFHTHGLFVGLNVSFLSKASLILLPTFNAQAVAASLPDATVLMGVPTYYTRLLEVPDIADLSSHVRLFISGSAPLLSATHHAWRESTGHEIVERYGMTETTMLTSNPIAGARRPGTVGRPLPGVNVQITDPDDNGIGMIQVAGPNVFLGYWEMPEKTAEAFTSDRHFITGDLGRIDDEGYLHIVGREKDLVIRGGYNVYPKEVETVLDALEGVAESAVFGIPDHDLGERVIAAIVLADGAAIREEQIADDVASQLARYKRPAAYMFMPSLPRNVMGKVQKSVLRDAATHLANAQ
ncbi:MULTISPECIES: AMP-binding protein [unclassified Microbacterium]|uniref:AMP-binding protein n=1 Tax=unclassified Microbacterium TaxID=2609290 RepID=UPI00214B5C6D|nr:MULTISPECIES: AMP-binding protein [unclassified Microbacterium]MCR2810520.1 AMP-binding protein [Microbacterium sp. zg.B185]WIM19505.1 AMP-binding protein [Microbacterium sp. zg-B185]